MSGIYNKKQGSTYLLNPLDPLTEAYLCSIFDEQVDYDIKEALVNKKQMKLYSKMCIYKILCFPLEYSLAFLVLGRSYAKDKWNAQKLYWKLLNKKVTIEEFNKEMLENIMA